jgi:ABC-type lipoprotein release transport system permease subunit
MNFTALLKLSIKYLLRYRRRYLFLFFALTFGFCIVTVITAFKTGISENLYLSAQSHYAGDIVFLGKNNDGRYHRHIDDSTKSLIYDTIKESKIPITRYAERTIFNDHISLFFNGEFLFLRYLHGVDWHNEAAYFNALNYAAENLTSLNDDSIIISKQVAAVLNVHQGDSLILEVTNRYGQKNTWPFIVNAIVNDETLFGFYKAYISQKTMNYLLGFEENDCSSIGIFLPTRKNTQKAQWALWEILKQKTQTANFITDSEIYRMENNTPWEGLKIFILTIPIYLADLHQLIEAFDILNYFLYSMILIIIFVSAGVTYRLILHERTKEIGTMRAIGFQAKNICGLLSMEIILLGTISILSGLCLARLLCIPIQYLPLSSLPSFKILLSENSRLSAVFTPLVIVNNIMAIYIILLAAVSIPTLKVSKAPLPEMLSGSVKG